MNRIELRSIVRPKARAAFACCLMVASVDPALAYVDPGTGSMLVQMFVASIAGAMFYFRELRLQLVAWFRRTVLGRPTSTDSATADGEQPPARAGE